MNFTYLLIGLGVLIIPLILVFIKQTRFSKGIRTAIPAALVAGIIFSIFASVLVLLKVWIFNPAYLTGITIWQIPAEEMFFYMSMSFAGIGIYTSLNSFFPNNNLDKFSLSFSNLILGVCIAMLFFTYTKWYSAVAFGTLFVLIFYIEYLNKLRFSFRLYRAYFLFLLIFWGCQAIITTLPIALYVNTINLKLGSIPFESHFYYLALLLLSVYLFELFKVKVEKRKAAKDQVVKGKPISGKYIKAKAKR